MYHVSLSITREAKYRHLFSWNFRHWLYRKLSYDNFRCSQWRKFHENYDITVSVSYMDGLVQDCSNSIANALGLLQPSTKPIKYIYIYMYIYAFLSTVRLVNGDTADEGRLEIFHDGVWGTICDDLFDDIDATVACRQLGYVSGVAHGSATFGRGEDPIHLDDVECVGDEREIGICPHIGWGSHNCGHGEDVGVVCSEWRFNYI